MVYFHQHITPIVQVQLKKCIFWVSNGVSKVKGVDFPSFTTKRGGLSSFCGWESIFSLVKKKQFSIFVHMWSGLLPFLCRQFCRAIALVTFFWDDLLDNNWIYTASSQYFYIRCWFFLYLAYLLTCIS